MAVYKFSNVSGFKNYQKYNDFLAGNPAVQLDKGSMFPLGVFTLASTASEINFTNIPQTYTHLQVRYITPFNIQDAALIIQFNGDTGTNYRCHELRGNGASTPISGGTANILYSCYDGNITRNSAYLKSGIIDVLDYKNTNKNKTVRALGGIDINGAGSIVLDSGLWTSTNAITSMRIQQTGYDGTSYGIKNFAINTSFALYGVNA